MLVLTKNASTVISSLVAERELPPDAGLRISAVGNTDDPLRISTAVVPDDTDTVVEEEGARVFLEPNAADMLDDKVLDAVVEQGQVQFVLARQ